MHGYDNDGLIVQSRKTETRGTTIGSRNHITKRQHQYIYTGEVPKRRDSEPLRGPTSAALALLTASGRTSARHG